VNSNDVVAEANLTPEHLLLDISRGLGVSAGEADRYLQYKMGDEVSADDVLAGPVGIGRRVVRAPEAGKVVIAGDGQVLLEVESKLFELRAGIPGVAVELLPDRGVVIETTGALVQGVWGNGRTDFGLLNVRMESPEDILTNDSLDVSLRGSIVMGGYCDQEEVITSVSGMPLRGLILGSMASSLVPIAARVRFPIIVLEGFGHIPMNLNAFNLLSTSERREVSLNAEFWNQYEKTRPEVVIPLPVESYPALPTESDSFGAGQQVRIIRAPYKSMIGSILSLHQGYSLMPSGVRARAAEIQFENGEKAVLPLANLELIE
jgi:hypothetical protein